MADFQRGPGARFRQPSRGCNIDWDKSPERQLALTVQCRHCKAPEGQRCVKKNGRFLQNFPAHPCRINDAKAVAP